MSLRLNPDITIRKRDGSPIAIVEVKNKRELTEADASFLRGGFLAHGLMEDIPYFLVLSQDVGYLWHQEAPATGADVDAFTRFSMDAVLRRFVSEADREVRLHGAELELVVWQWLTEIAGNGLNADREPECQLRSSGFLDALQETSVRIEEAA